MKDEETILDEATDNLKAAAQRIRATRNSLWAGSLDEHPDYKDLSQRLSSALAMTEAAYMEARRRGKQGNNR